MKEKHYAYKINPDASNLVCTYSEIEKHKMVDLLKEIHSKHSDGIYWIFKQFDDKPKEELCIIDCPNNRIYYHYSGEVEALEDTIARLSQ